jgi:hypothetical protein
MKSEQLYKTQETLLFFKQSETIYCSFKSEKPAPYEAKVIKQTTSALLNQGFSLAEIEQLVDLKPNDGAFEYFKAKGGVLLQQFGMQTLVTVFRVGRVRSLMAIERNYQTLLQMEFTSDQIIKIASHNGGCLAIEATVEQTPHLKMLGFNQQQIFAICNELNAAENLPAAVKYAPFLLERAFIYKEEAYQLTHDEVVRIANRRRGHERLAMLANLLQQNPSVHFSKKKLLSCATRNERAEFLKLQQLCHVKMTEATETPGVRVTSVKEVEGYRYEEFKVTPVNDGKAMRKRKRDEQASAEITPDTASSKTNKRDENDTPTAYRESPTSLQIESLIAATLTAHSELTSSTSTTERSPSPLSIADNSSKEVVIPTAYRFIPVVSVTSVGFTLFRPPLVLYRKDRVESTLVQSPIHTPK